MPILTTANLEYKITNLNVNAIDLTIRLTLARGIIENGGFTILTISDLDISREDTILLINSAPTGVTLYDSLKIVLYQYLIDKGLAVGVIG
jgi:hypothetical protein